MSSLAAATMLIPPALRFNPTERQPAPPAAPRHHNQPTPLLQTEGVLELEIAPNRPAEVEIRAMDARGQVVVTASESVLVLRAFVVVKVLPELDIAKVAANLLLNPSCGMCVMRSGFERVPYGASGSSGSLENDSNSFSPGVSATTATLQNRLLLKPYLCHRRVSAICSILRRSATW